MSSIIPKIRAEVKGQKLSFNKTNKDLLNKVLKQYEGKSVEIVIKRKRNKRTSNQNAYYWGVVLKLVSEHTGETKLNLSLIFRKMFLKKEIRKIIGKKITIIRGTSKLESDEFAEYIEKTISEKWIDQVNKAKTILQRGKETYEQINILGDDGVPIDYHITFWKSEIIDFVILQQDAFDKIDQSTPIERQ